jgi:SPP1 gp7 family putative phage head morphogenesis protein
MSKDRGVKIARTEVIHAHAEGQLDSFQALGIEEVGAEVEWVSTPDERRCSLCEELHGQRFTIAEARGMLPRHPSCRCAWAPVV